MLSWAAIKGPCFLQVKHKLKIWKFLHKAAMNLSFFKKTSVLSCFERWLNKNSEDFSLNFVNVRWRQSEAKSETVSYIWTLFARVSHFFFILGQFPTVRGKKWDSLTHLDTFCQSLTFFFVLVHFSTVRGKKWDSLIHLDTFCQSLTFLLHPRTFSHSPRQKVRQSHTSGHFLPESHIFSSSSDIFPQSEAKSETVSHIWTLFANLTFFLRRRTFFHRLFETIKDTATPPKIPQRRGHQRDGRILPPTPDHV